MRKTVLIFLSICCRFLVAAQSDFNIKYKLAERFQLDLNIPIKIYDLCRQKEFAEMNHLFQTCKIDALDEYATIEQTMDPKALAEISGWVSKTTR